MLPAEVDAVGRWIAQARGARAALRSAPWPRHARRLPGSCRRCQPVAAGSVPAGWQARLRPPRLSLLAPPDTSRSVTSDGAYDEEAALAESKKTSPLIVSQIAAMARTPSAPGAGPFPVNEPGQLSSTEARDADHTCPAEEVTGASPGSLALYVAISPEAVAAQYRLAGVREFADRAPGRVGAVEHPDVLQCQGQVVTEFGTALLACH